MTLTHYAIMAGTFAFIAAIFLIAWRGYMTSHQEQDDELASEAEADQRIKFRTQIWDGQDHHTIN